MPTAPIAMAAASERPAMIVSAGYFSSRRTPSFQSSQEIAFSGRVGCTILTLYHKVLCHEPPRVLPATAAGCLRPARGDPIQVRERANQHAAVGNRGRGERHLAE